VIWVNDRDALIFAKFGTSTVGSLVEDQLCFWCSMLEVIHITVTDRGK